MEKKVRIDKSDFFQFIADCNNHKYKSVIITVENKSNNIVCSIESINNDLRIQLEALASNTKKNKLVKKFHSVLNIFQFNNSDLETETVLDYLEYIFKTIWKSSIGWVCIQLNDNNISFPSKQKK